MAKIYTTSRIGNNGRKYIGVNIANHQFEIPGKQISGVKTKSFAIPGYAKAKTVTYNPNNYDKTRMAGVIYDKKNQSIKQTETIVRETPRKTIIKTTKYGPVNYYGKQEKFTTKKVIKK